MYRLEKTSRDHERFLSPSFSSALLDQIYRSIDEGDTKSGETKFYREEEEEEETTSFKKQTDRKQNDKPRSEKVVVKETADNRKSRQQQRDGVDHDQDVLFFSSTSISSDSSSGSGFSSSDTDSLSRSSCFAQPRQPKPVRTSTSFRMEKEKQGTRVFDGFCLNFDAKQGTEIRGEEAVLIKNKSRALKIYNNLKKVKQPISPGGRLTSFLNSLFATTGNNNVKKKKKKKKSKDTCEDVNSNNNTERKANSTCSSVRSCLSKTTSSSHKDIHGLRNGVNKTVRFCQVEEKESSVVEEESAARKFLKEYRNNHKKNDLVLKDLPIINHNDEEEEDDVASDASSDLFELDHLAVFGSARYREELPVYETTRVSTNRAIANGII